MICQILGEERYKNEAKIRKYALEIAFDKYRNEFWIYRLFKLLKLSLGLFLPCTMFINAGLSNWDL